MTRLVDRAAGVLARRVDRRGFLSRSAVVGSAVVAAPLEYGLKPKSAYAAVCGCSGARCSCGALCCDGWTEFCCTLSGVNRCPDGTVAGGWWKVDGSQFCGGGPRYYLDCNAQCGGCGCGGGICSGACSGTGCGCAKGDCNNRKSGCTRFRYGNCHQEIPCLGPIVCRVVTCVAPWIYDPACTTASRTSEATRNHNRSCVIEPFGSLDAAVDEGGALRVVGWAIDQNPGAVPPTVQIFSNLTSVALTPANRPRSDVRAAYPGYPGDHGFDVTIPVPSGDHMVCAYAIDPDNGTSKFLGVAMVRVAPLAGRIQGATYLGNGVVRVHGWTASRQAPATPLKVHVGVERVLITEVLADQFRADVAAAEPALGPNHGFTIDLNLPPGAHQVCATAFFPSGGTSSLGCWPVVVL